MGWAAGGNATDPAAGAVLVEADFTHGRPTEVVIVVRAQRAFEAIFRLIDYTGRTISEMILPIAPRLWSSPVLGPINVPANGRLRVVTRSAVVGEVEVSLFYT